MSDHVRDRRKPPPQSGSSAKQERESGVAAGHHAGDSPLHGSPRLARRDDDLAGKADRLNQRPAVRRQRGLASSLGGRSAPLEAPIQARENRTGLPAGLKTGIEQLSGYSMDDVRVHFNSASPIRIGAAAFTRGSEIHVGPGAERHLAHEAWHVVQQKQGRVRPTMREKGLGINDEAGLEREADAMGAAARTAAAPVPAPGQGRFAGAATPALEPSSAGQAVQRYVIGNSGRMTMEDVKQITSYLPAHIRNAVNAYCARLVNSTDPNILSDIIESVIRTGTYRIYEGYEQLGSDQEEEEEERKEQVGNDSSSAMSDSLGSSSTMASKGTWADLTPSDHSSGKGTYADLGPTRKRSKKDSSSASGRPGDLGKGTYATMKPNNNNTLNMSDNEGDPNEIFAGSDQIIDKVDEEEAKAAKQVAASRLKKTADADTNPVFVSVAQIAPENRKITYKADELYVNDLAIGAQRYETQFQGQARHTVSFTILRGSFAALQGKGVEHALKRIFELRDLIRSGNPANSKAGRILSMIGYELGDLLVADVTPQMWSGLLSHLIDIVFRADQVSGNATYKDDRPKAHGVIGEGPAMQNLHSVNLRLAAGDDIPAEDLAEVPISAVSLIDTVYSPNLAARAYAQSVVNWAWAFRVRFPAIWENGDMKKAIMDLILGRTDVAAYGLGAANVEQLLAHFRFPKFW